MFIRFCSLALSTDLCTDGVWQTKRGCMHRTHERLRELGFSSESASWH